uniref:3,4-dihydroxy-2-butanone-4-phosphate synthase n=1 Tax=Mycolicibacterium brisbanense TaxID=146020 RepID=B8R4J5_9MYCO|nr:hypothetical protein [Mycolicibacterium brisbanense]
MNASLAAVPTAREVSAALRGHRPVVVLTSTSAILAFSASAASTALVAFAVRHSTGMLFALTASERLDRLRIPDQPTLDSEHGSCRVTVAVDAAAGISTGISARDRARTLRTLGDVRSVATDLIRPGHILPVRCGEPGDAPELWARVRRIIVEATGDEVAGACHLVDRAGDIMDPVGGRSFAAEHDLLIVPVESADRLSFG